MPAPSPRLTSPGNPPTAGALKTWLGPKAHALWEKTTAWIAQNHPGVFTPEWLYGGKKHGWYLRYKKSKSFCSLIPEKKRAFIMIVFGAEERQKVETIRAQLSEKIQKTYDDAAVYHDGKWLLLPLESESTLKDAKQLLMLKRKIKIKKSPHAQ